MASSKEIRNQIKSVKNTQKITKAMEMVSVSKMRKAQDRMRQARPYADKIRDITAHLSNANPEYVHPFMKQREQIRKAGIILVSSDKGLCGGLNTNIFRAVTQKMQTLHEQGAQIQATAIGSKGLGFMHRHGVKIVSHLVQPGDVPRIEKLIPIIKVQIDDFLNGTIDAVYLAYTRFVNTMTQTPVVEQLLPIPEGSLDRPDPGYSWDYVYEPSPQAVLDELMIRYIDALIYQALAENMASEHSARVVAMKAASDNAKKIINELQLSYNKARQAAITQELSEIVGGAAAV
ncbi:MAG: F0F1 ATP synthase subunit gamma [Lautropia sp.]|nr:F0F1 ATP synthase subunit gamma [Lautropia sp.]